MLDLTSLPLDADVNQPAIMNHIPNRANVPDGLEWIRLKHDEMSQTILLHAAEQIVEP